ncbi:MAG: GntR family transcriptional regulator [Pseudomonadales bacterium]
MKTAHERAYERIRARIFSGKLSAGSQLKEEELAALLGVSRTPIRQAIRQLADQGLVTIRSNHRAYVAEVTEAQFEVLFDLLVFLESYSAGLAATRITPDEVKHLRDLCDELDRTVQDSPQAHKAFLDINDAFHHYIHKIAGNQQVYDLICRIIEFPHNLYLKFGQINAEHNPTSVIQHRSIVDALARGDRGLAELQMRIHTESVRRAFRQLWTEFDNQPTADPSR